MTVKFRKILDTDIRRAYLYDGENNLGCIYLIGQVSELLEKDIIFADNTKGNENKWLTVTKGGDISEHETLEQAKDYCKTHMYIVK